ncbi:hypothetical protein TNIN_109051 [Trichonephila inaurata madagascariensis]|uniref:Uncharacterized protein n=1 Tax=Trichonephila inaurata madagascariensis TaxID=2747483 RepID=A0A8X6X393_9ARAC|nr:hypothetical protein TNIN_109051 [Trichonephila inaurata madagascariensis]
MEREGKKEYIQELDSRSDWNPKGIDSPSLSLELQKHQINVDPHAKIKIEFLLFLRRKEEAKESRRLAQRKAPGRRLDNRFGRGHYRRDLGADRWSAVNDPLHQGPLSILIAFIEASIFYLFRGFFVSASFPSLGRWSVPRKDWTDGQRRENLRLK